MHDSTALPFVSFSLITIDLFVEDDLAYLTIEDDGDCEIQVDEDNQPQGFKGIMRLRAQADIRKTMAKEQISFAWHQSLRAPNMRAIVTSTNQWRREE
ncbi:hypothetical protein V6N13_072524 [Hibiscus sabdariffa]